MSPGSVRAFSIWARLWRSSPSSLVRGLVRDGKEPDALHPPRLHLHDLEGPLRRLDLVADLGEPAEAAEEVAAQGGVVLILDLDAGALGEVAQGEPAVEERRS